MAGTTRSVSTLVVALVAAASSAALIAWLRENHKKKKKSEKQQKDDNTMRQLSSLNDPKTLRGPPVGQIDCGPNGQKSQQQQQQQRILKRSTISIVHGSVTGMCRGLAQELHDRCVQEFPNRCVQMYSIQEFDWWDELINDENDDDEEAMSSSNAAAKKTTPILLILLPTYTNGTWTPTSQTLQDALSELSTDWRIAKFPLKKKLQVGIWGVGSSAYDDGTMGRPAREAVRQFQTLGAKCIVRLQVGDDAASTGTTRAKECFEAWSQTVVRQLHKQQATNNNNKKGESQKQSATDPSTKKKVSAQAHQHKPPKPRDCGSGSDKENSDEQGGCACKSSETEKSPDSEGCCQSSPSTNPVGLDGEDDNDDDYDYDDDDDSEQGGGEPEVIDLEDMGDAILASQQNNNNNNKNEPREMVTPSQAAALKKEGYKLIGTHSAVKLCRWTKHQLRGRGGCYKHTFYGITSYQCMEATPSLACANKCVFCWRHHKNPVGKEWRWKTDSPDYIVEQAVQTHVHMIKEARGIPGVRMDRWQEAHTVRHCALSLVGEPIMYPHINQLLQELHNRHISTFLVTNGQHPAAIDSLIPITQLYVSVDAPTKSSLIEIDRPLFGDAWERLRESLTSLKNKGQRTVARLTVVKGWNSDEIQGYAELIALGHVGLVEVKGVTYCGKSDASNLNMSNTPWHHEVVALTQQLKVELDKVRQAQLQQGKEEVVPEYGLACEHKHSCSVLLARVDQFSEPCNNDAPQQRRWRTWIDYDKFQELAAKHVTDPSFTFSVQDYTAETPAWALFGANEEGFDPTETRHRKKTKHPKYTQFDARGVPTHDHNHQPLSVEERARLSKLLEERVQELGGVEGESVITQHRDGAKEIQDASLMFRGLVVTK